MYFLDTSAIIELIYGTKKGEQIKALIKDHPLSISSFTVYELSLALKENEIETIKKIFNDIDILNFDKKSALKSAEIELFLKKKGNMINKVDIFIAGICLIHNYNLISCDHDFNKIKDLKSTIF